LKIFIFEEKKKKEKNIK